MKELLIKLREIYVYNVDENGPKTPIDEIIKTWDKINELIK